MVAVEKIEVTISARLIFPLRYTVLVVPSNASANLGSLLPVVTLASYTRVSSETFLWAARGLAARRVKNSMARFFFILLQERWVKGLKSCLKYQDLPIFAFQAGLLTNSFTKLLS